jgi:hypothetical protein
MNEEITEQVTYEKTKQAGERTPKGYENYSNVRVNDTVGTVFLGLLAILMLVFLVRANRRNRELLLEVVSLRRQS